MSDSSSGCGCLRPSPPSSGFRDVLIHEYVALDMDRVVEALARLEPIERFAAIVREALEAAARS